jgi:hypothetical protein
MSNETVELKFIGKGPRVVLGTFIETDETRKFTEKQAVQLMASAPKDWKLIGELPKGFGKPKKVAKDKGEEQANLLDGGEQSSSEG